MLRLRAPEGGRIEVAGTDVATLRSAAGVRELRREIQIVLQDPTDALDPRMTVLDLLAEPLPAGAERTAVRSRVPRLLDLVGLDRAVGDRFPAALSGGQRRRVGIARALAREPKLLVLDEPLSALDVSVRAGTVNLLVRLKRELALAYLVAAHDLAVVRGFSDRIAVMYLGHVVESGATEEIFARPRPPYTEALLSAVPLPDPQRERRRERIVLEGEQPSAARLRVRRPLPAPPSGRRGRAHALPHRTAPDAPRAGRLRPPVRLPRALTPAHPFPPAPRSPLPPAPRSPLPTSPSHQGHPMRREFVLPLVLVAALSVAATGCSSSSSSGDSSGRETRNTAEVASSVTDYNPQPYENLKDGGTCTTAGTFDEQGNPFNVNGTLNALRIWSWYNADAITYPPTGEVQYNPDYYSDVKVSVEDGDQKVVITLDPRAAFNDGTPIDRRAVEATWKANNGSDKEYAASSTDGYDRITSVTPGADDKQAVIAFKGVNASWSALFTTFLHPRAATVENFNKAYVKTAHPERGTGPYTAGSWDAQSGNITFVRNPVWWGRRGKLDKRVYVNLERAASINAFKNGGIDYAPVGDAENLKQVKAVKDAEVRSGGSPFEYALYLNTRSPFLGDVQVRKAVQKSIDRSQITKIRFQGLDCSEPLPGSAVLYSFQQGYRDNVSAVLTYDPQEARRTLDEAGWKPGADGIRAEDGKELELGYTLLGDDPVEKAVSGARCRPVRPPTPSPTTPAARRTWKATRQATPRSASVPGSNCCPAMPRSSTTGRSTPSTTEV
ncbi:ABC transporter substrate-binding protein [Kitasatospora purpeofusca]|uniref:ABC transporter substrate-binding protein n=1 Tax=Kitasatospora purpeofusca TaxID=67352 RepID=UPI00386325E9|nr:ABC transporter substrate-binding protein [Kitasatospora purpeofusca]